MKVRSLFVSSLCCISLLSGCRQDAKLQNEGESYPLMTLKPEDRQLSVKYSAVIEGKQDVEIRPQVSGTITQVCVEEGAHVRKGQVLFIIDQIPYKAAVQKAEAAVATAEANEAIARQTLEGKVVRLSDKIAYINHDIDDAIRARIFSEDYIPKEYTDVLGTTTKSRLNTLISDIIKCSIDKDDIIMSDTVHKAMTDLRQFMFDKLYTNPAAKSEEVKVCKLITELYNYYIDNIEELPDNYKRFIYERGEKPERVVCDYIAGMSDQYSISRFENIFVPKAWKG